MREKARNLAAAPEKRKIFRGSLFQLFADPCGQFFSGQADSGIALNIEIRSKLQFLRGRGILLLTASPCRNKRINEVKNDKKEQTSDAPLYRIRFVIFLFGRVILQLFYFVGYDFSVFYIVV